MSTSPKVSIILPTYNGAIFLARAIESIIRQTLENWELHIIDDGSTDETPEIAEKYAAQDPRVKALRNERNLGIQKSLNRGLEASRGSFIARIDDDDEWSDASKLAAQVRFLDAHPDCVLVGTGTVVTDESGKEIFRFLNPETDAQIRDKLLGKNCFTHSSVLFRKNAALECGGYDESAKTRHVEDYDLWLKLGTKGKLANLPLYAVRFTMRRGNISSKNKIEQFKKDIMLTIKYWRSYPNFPGALLRGCARLLLYGVFNLIPIAEIKTRFLRLYKER